MKLVTWAEAHELTMPDMQRLFNVSKATVSNWLVSNRVGSEVHRQLIWAVQPYLPGLSAQDILEMAPTKTYNRLTRLGIADMAHSREVLLKPWQKDELPKEFERVRAQAEFIALRNKAGPLVDRRPGRPAHPITEAGLRRPKRRVAAEA